jgi:hypothetical protein
MHQARRLRVAGLIAALVWTRVTAPLEIRAHKAILTYQFEDGIDVGEALTVFAQRTSKYSRAERSRIVDVCVGTLDTLQTLAKRILRPFKMGAWKRINVFVSRKFSHTGGPGCDVSMACGLAHPMASMEDGPCRHHIYMVGSVQVRVQNENGICDDIADTVLHELIHALHFRNEYERGAGVAYTRAMMRLMALLVEYRAMDGECTFYDWYAATNVYEFVVGVAQVLARKKARICQNCALS